MAEFHSARRVLPEWATADLDRLVYAAPAALVPRGDGDGNADTGAGAGMDDVPAAATAHLVFSYHYAMANWDHPFG